MRFVRRSWIVIPVAVILFFAAPLIRGQVLIPGDILHVVDDVWTTNARAHNPLQSDILFQFYPWQTYLFSQLRHGILPLWNPYILTGSPFLANDQAAPFEPVRLLVCTLGISTQNAFLACAILRLSLLGVFAWLLFRKKGFGQPESILGSLLLTFSSVSIAWLSYPLFAVFIWLPLICFAVEDLRDHPRRGMLLLALGTAAQFFGGNVQMSLFELTAAVVYAAFMVRWSWPMAIRIVTGFVLGALLAAVQLLPAYQFIRQSNQYATGRSNNGTTSVIGAFRDGSWLGWHSFHDVKTNLETLVPIVSPFVYGNPATATYVFPNKDLKNNFNELASSIGVVGLFFAILGIAVAWRERMVKVAAGTIAACAAVIAHAPIITLVNYLPLFQKASTGRLRFIIVFMLTILAVYGLRAFLRRTALLRLSLISGTVTFVIFGLSVVMEHSGGRTENVLWVMVSFALVGVAWFMVKRPVVAITVLGLAVLAVPFVMLRSYNTSVAASELYPAAPILASLSGAGMNYRVAGWSDSDSLRAPLLPNGGMLYGVYDVRGYEVVRVASFDALTDGILGRSGSYVNSIAALSPLLDAMSVRYVIMTASSFATHAEELSVHGWTVAQRIGGLIAVENSHAAPRAYLAGTVYETNTASEAHDVVHGPFFDPTVPVIETGVEKPASQTTAAITAASVTADTGNTVTVSVASNDQSRFLVLTDAFTPGWQVTVDGVAAPLYRANESFRAVRVSQGPHTVVFTYRPKSVSIGAWLSAGAALLVFGSVFIQRKKRA